MKKSLRFLSLFLALLFCLTTFAACNNDPEETEDTTDGEAETVDELMPDIKKQNYGTEFFLSIQSDMNPMDWHWVEESKNDVMTEAVYNRTQQVQKYLGVEVIGSKAGAYEDYTSQFMTAVKNMDDSVHMLITHPHIGNTSLVREGYLADLSTFDGLDLEADYWTQDFMEELAVEGKMFLGNNRFNILNTYVIVFNKVMMEQQKDYMESSVYEMVQNKTWTLGEMISLAELVHTDNSGDGKTEDDIYGLTGTNWVPTIGFLHASNIPLIAENDAGVYQVAVDNEVYGTKTVALLDTLSAFFKSDSAWFRYRIEETPTITLDSNRALMSLSQTGSLQDLSEKDVDFGILPYPMYDETQASVGYRHLQWGGFTVLPSYVKDPEMVADTVEMLAYYSTDVSTAFYDKLMGKQAADNTIDRDMLNIVWDTICADFGQAFADITGILYMVPELTNKADSSFASYIGGKKTSINNNIRKFLVQVKKIGKQ